MTYVKSYKRRTKKGKTITVDALNKETHIAIVDTDSRSMTTITKNEPFEAEKVVVHEQPAALNIVVLGKKKRDRKVKGKLVKGKQLKSKTAVNITTLF